MNIVIAGFGVVSQALVEQLDAQAARLHDDHGFEPRVVGVLDSRGAAYHPGGLETAALLDAKRAGGSVAAIAPGGRAIADAAGFIAQCDADVLVEATPSVLGAPAAALERLKAAFRSGKHAISVNKAPLAVAMPALLELAAYNRVQFRFSGTVGAGTPMLDLAERCAQGDEVRQIRAIVNGTTNYILWRMHEHGDAFADALADATRLGYAESDPSADIDGIDTATKLVILANHVLKRRVAIEDVRIAGIRDFPRARIEEAAGRGERCKLVAEIGETLCVGPRTVKVAAAENVPANLNAITLDLRHSGPVTLVGRGAGGPETAVAVIRDLLDIWHAVGDDT